MRRGEPTAQLSETRSALMRYRGQGHEIAVPLAAKAYRSEDAAEIVGAFEDAYRRLYSRIIPGVEVEVLSWVVLVSGPAPVADGEAAGVAHGFRRGAGAPPPGLRPGARGVRRGGDLRAPVARSRRTATGTGGHR